jgi:NAD(P)H-flavin reductase
VLVGTGTGITPYRAMLPELRRRMEHDYSVHVLLGVWGRTEALFGEDFVAAAAEHPAFGYTACYSREKLADLADWERQGYVQAAYDNLRLDPDRDIVYLCGNPAMIDESVEILKGRGFDLKRLRREKYVSARPAR